MIAALAGRRVDPAETTTPRFPPAQIEHVEMAIRSRLAADDVSALVCAAACGADLLALAAAAELGVRRRIVLPFSVELFRRSSVIDRPGTYNWEEQYDRFWREAESCGDLVLLDLDPNDPHVYEKANLGILDHAVALAAESGDEAEALVVWDERSRGPGDITEHFAREAQLRMPVRAIHILDALR